MAQVEREYMLVYEYMLNRLGVDHKCDRQRDGQSDGHNAFSNRALRTHAINDKCREHQPARLWLRLCTLHYWHLEGWNSKTVILRALDYMYLKNEKTWRTESREFYASLLDTRIRISKANKRQLNSVMSGSLGKTFMLNYTKDESSEDRHFSCMELTVGSRLCMYFGVQAWGINKQRRAVQTFCLDV